VPQRPPIDVTIGDTAGGTIDDTAGGSYGFSTAAMALAAEWL